jgi:hypothetical protein
VLFVCAVCTVRVFGLCRMSPAKALGLRSRGATRVRRLDGQAGPLVTRRVRQLETDLRCQGRGPTHPGQRCVARICCSVAQSGLLSLSVSPYLGVLLSAIVAHPLAEGSQCNFTALSFPDRGRPIRVDKDQCLSVDPGVGERVQ